MADSNQNISVIMKTMNWAYDQAIDGVGILGTEEKMAKEYLNANNQDRIKAANSLIRWQNTKTGTSGFITGLGGLPAMPLTVPADLASTLYIQLKMITAIAHMGGYNIRDDKVRTLAFACLVGDGIQEYFREVSIQFTQKAATSFIQKNITGAMLRQINQRVGFRLFTKVGSTGLVNFIKFVPVLGGIVGGSINATLNNIVGNTARNSFIGDNEENIYSEEVS